MPHTALSVSASAEPMTSRAMGDPRWVNRLIDGQGADTRICWRRCRPRDAEAHGQHAPAGASAGRWSERWEAKHVDAWPNASPGSFSPG